MKHLILLLFALLLLGCKDNGNDSPEVVEKEVVAKFERIARKQGFVVYKFTYQNHDYLCSYEGGIIHSQSCRCLNPN